MKTTIDIVIADNQLLFRQALKCLLQQENDLRVVGLASTAEELITIIKQQPADILIIDTKLNDVTAFKLVKDIKQLHSNIEIIALSSSESEYHIIQMLEAGVKSYLLKNADIKDLVLAINKAYQKKAHYCSRISEKIIQLFERENTQTTTKERQKLTEKENEIIKLICQEYASKEIAAKLNINNRSVEAARKRIQEKIGCRNMAGIIIYAIKNVIFPIEY